MNSCALALHFHVQLPVSTCFMSQKSCWYTNLLWSHYRLSLTESSSLTLKKTKRILKKMGHFTQRQTHINNDHRSFYTRRGINADFNIWKSHLNVLFPSLLLDQNMSSTGNTMYVFPALCCFSLLTCSGKARLSFYTAETTVWVTVPPAYTSHSLMLRIFTPPGPSIQDDSPSYLIEWQQFSGYCPSPVVGFL